MTIDDHVRNWTEAERRVKELERDLNSARSYLENIKTTLGRFLVPEQAEKSEETFSVWVNCRCIGFNEDRLLTVKFYPQRGNYAIEWRGKGKNIYGHAEEVV